MTALEALRMAVQGLISNRLRTLLTMLGITIGVASVIVLVAVGHGSAVKVNSQIESLGTNTLTVMPGGGFGFGGRGGPNSTSQQLTLRDAAALEDKQQAPDILTVAPVVDAPSATLSYDGTSYTPSQFVGTTPSYAAARDQSIAAGAFFTNQDETDQQRYVIVGPTVVTNLFAGQNPIGRTIKVNGVSFQVIGVLRSKGTNGIQDQDDIAIAPLSTTRSLLTGTTGGLSQIVIQARSSGQVDAAAAEIDAILAPGHTSNGSATYRVLNQASLLETTNATNHVFTVLLATVAAISLLVGGIGVMNIMLVTVTERTREIGIRKAIGARRIDILGQFLSEAALISVLGGVLGVAVGLIGSRFKIVGVQPAVQLYAVALAFSVGTTVGVFFGFYPANRAAALRPIDALRFE
jgi:putative ABC transport system permease protein